MPVAGEPLVRRIIRYASKQDVRDFVLNLHHLPETITAQVGDGSDLGVRVRYSFESPVLGSAGGPRKALSLLPDDDFFIINGDTLTSVDLGGLAANHRETGALVTIAVMPNVWPERYGGIIVDSTGRFHSVVPAGSRVRSYHVVGVQMAHPSAFARLPLNQPAESIGGLYKELVKDDPGHVRAFLCEAEFWDVGTPADYLEACLAIGRAEGDVSADRARLDRGPGGASGRYGGLGWRTDRQGRHAPALYHRRRGAHSFWSELPELRHHSERRTARRDGHPLMDTPSTALQETRGRIDECLHRAKLADPQVRVVPLTGDASTRQYFRILRPDNPSVVLAVYDAPFVYDELPFVNVCRLFTSIPLPIPAIAGHADDLGILILEDLGDVTLQAHLGVTQPADHDALYRQAVEFVFRMQRRGVELESDEFIPYRVAFDRDKLMWEMNFFVKHFLEAYHGASITAAARDALNEEFLRIVDELAAEPRVLCHRDYHSRNLMLHDRSLYIIDFQDARMGPDTYDLASLLRDSYVDLPDARVDDLDPRISETWRPGRGDARCIFGVPAAIRSHVGAAQSEGARHLRPSDDRTAQSRVHSVHPQDVEQRSHEPGAVPPLRPAPRNPVLGRKGPAPLLACMKKFGVSTHLYHEQRLDLTHVLEIAASGFEAVELFATRSHFDYHDETAIGTLKEWLTQANLELHSVHAPMTDVFVNGRGQRTFSTAVS